MVAGQEGSANVKIGKGRGRGGDPETLEELKFQFHERRVSSEEIFQMREGIGRGRGNLHNARFFEREREREKDDCWTIDLLKIIFPTIFEKVK